MIRFIPNRFICLLLLNNKGVKHRCSPQIVRVDTWFTDKMSLLFRHLRNIRFAVPISRVYSNVHAFARVSLHCDIIYIKYMPIFRYKKSLNRKCPANHHKIPRLTALPFSSAKDVTILQRHKPPMMPIRHSVVPDLSYKKHSLLRELYRLTDEWCPKMHTIFFVFT